MLSKEENDFILYWEKNRLRQKKLGRQFLVGIPLGLLFVVPTVISFSSGWYKRADMEANNGEFNPMVLFVALLLIVGFTAIFYQRWKWDQYEQRYRELVVRRDRAEGPGVVNGTGAAAVAGAGATVAATGVEGAGGTDPGAPKDGAADPEMRSSGAKN